MNDFQISQDIKRLEKKVQYTRLAAVPLVLILALGFAFDISLTIMAPIVFVLMAIIIIGVGIPTQRKLSNLKKQLRDM